MYLDSKRKLKKIDAWMAGLYFTCPIFSPVHNVLKNDPLRTCQCQHASYSIIWSELLYLSALCWWILCMTSGPENHWACWPPLVLCVRCLCLVPESAAPLLAGLLSFSLEFASSPSAASGEMRSLRTIETMPFITSDCNQCALDDGPH